MHMIDTDNNNNNKQYININEKILRLKNVKKGRYKINKNDAQINNIIIYHIFEHESFIL